MKRRDPPSILIATNGVEAVITHIEGLLAQGVLSGGQRLPETQIAIDVGVGRAQVREALRILAGDGVLDLKPNSGARVRTLNDARLIEMLDFVNALIALALPAYLKQRMFKSAVRRLIATLGPEPREDAPDGALALLTAMQAFNAEIIAGSGNSILNDALKHVHFSHYNGLLVDRMPYPALIAMRRNNLDCALALRDGDFDHATRLLGNAYGAAVAGLRGISVP